MVTISTNGSRQFQTSYQLDGGNNPKNGDLIEVSGNLHPGDMVVRRATDEIREGTPIQLSPKKTP